jgi:hypothetical protein
MKSWSQRVPTSKGVCQAAVTSQQDNSADDACTNILATLWKFAQFPGGEPLEQDQFDRLTAPLIDFNIKNGNIVVARVRFNLMNSA